MKTLGERMKQYEYVERKYLTPKIPIIIRLDGKAFHTFCKGMKKPYDEIMMQSMIETAKYLCENIQGVKLAYTQSDEITLVLYDQNPKSEGWFNYNVQKMVSVSASMATLAFNKAFDRFIHEYIMCKPDLTLQNTTDEDEETLYRIRMFDKIDKALFDSRVFSIPEYEVINCLIWRQQDAIRNSIQISGHTYFSDKELHGKSCDEIQDMLFLEKNINWDKYPVVFKRGCCIIKKEHYITNSDGDKIKRSSWVPDYSIPIFTQNRCYIESRLKDEEI